jgi:cytidylate kinase
VDAGDRRATARVSKRVDLKVSVPKGLRTRVREIARRRGVSADEVVEQILEAALDER